MLCIYLREKEKKEKIKGGFLLGHIVKLKEH